VLELLVGELGDGVVINVLELVGGLARVAGLLGRARIFPTLLALRAAEAPFWTSPCPPPGIVQLGACYCDRFFELPKRRQQPRALELLKRTGGAVLVRRQRLALNCWLEGRTSRHACCSAAIKTSARP
jgi:hypothetical protein